VGSFDGENQCSTFFVAFQNIEGFLQEEKMAVKLEAL